MKGPWQSRGDILSFSAIPRAIHEETVVPRADFRISPRIMLITGALAVTARSQASGLRQRAEARCSEPPRKSGLGAAR